LYNPGRFPNDLPLSAVAALTVTLSPNSMAAPGSGTSTMTVQVGPSARLGKHIVTITAIGGGVKHGTNVTVNVLN